MMWSNLVPFNLYKVLIKLPVKQEYLSSRNEDCTKRVFLGFNLNWTELQQSNLKQYQTVKLVYYMGTGKADVKHEWKLL